MASPRVLNPIVQRSAHRMDRVTRQPSTPFGLVWKPWQLQPCGLFPVLPGETLTSAMLQMQFWTDPLLAALKNTPWVFEYWMFYCKFRDLPGWEAGVDGLGKDLIDMIETGESMTANQGGRAYTYTKADSVDFLLEALKRITECYFREDGQAWDAGVADGVPLAHAQFGVRRDIMDRLSVGMSGAEDRRSAMPGYLGGALEEAYMNYVAQRNAAAGELLAMDYEDIVRAAGGKVVARNPEREDLHVPELLAYARHFDYPVNTVEPSTGVPAVAFGHRMKSVMRKSYLFTEFGWVVPIVCARPKAGWLNQECSFASFMTARDRWFMPDDDPDADSHWTSLGGTVGPLATIVPDGSTYVFDFRQLLWSGEQFYNYVPSKANDVFVTLPDATGKHDYPTATDITDMFAGTSANGRIRANGVIDLAVKTYPVVNPGRTQDDRGWSNRD